MSKLSLPESPTPKCDIKELYALKPNHGDDWIRYLKALDDFVTGTGGRIVKRSSPHNSPGEFDFYAEYDYTAKPDFRSYPRGRIKGDYSTTFLSAVLNHFFGSIFYHPIRPETTKGLMSFYISGELDFGNDYNEQVERLPQLTDRMEAFTKNYFFLKSLSRLDVDTAMLEAAINSPYFTSFEMDDRNKGLSIRIRSPLDVRSMMRLRDFIAEEVTSFAKDHSGIIFGEGYSDPDWEGPAMRSYVFSAQVGEYEISFLKFSLTHLLRIDKVYDENSESVLEFKIETEHLTTPSYLIDSEIVESSLKVLCSALAAAAKKFEERSTPCFPSAGQMGGYSL